MCKCIYTVCMDANTTNRLRQKTKAVSFRFSPEIIEVLDILASDNSPIHHHDEADTRTEWLQICLCEYLKNYLAGEISNEQISNCYSRTGIINLFIKYAKAVSGVEGYYFTTDDKETRFVHRPEKRTFISNKNELYGCFIKTEAETWQKFFATGEEYYRNLLMEIYLPLVKYIADRIYARMSEKVELDDLISVGIFGLMDAIDAFDPEHGVTFETYCTPMIRGAILGELRNMDWVPNNNRSRAHQFENVIQKLEAHLGRLPTDNEIANEMELEMSNFDKLLRNETSRRLVSLSDKFLESDGDKDLREIINFSKGKEGSDLLIEAQKRDLKHLLTTGLTRAERLIVILYYYEKMAMREIGATLDLSEEKVSQMHSSIIVRLKAQMNARKKEFESENDMIRDRPKNKES